MNYWLNQSNFLGIGVGGYSKLNSTRFGNSKSLKKYFDTFENKANLQIKIEDMIKLQ
jgi:coproporphyrinogen III oxidase-like Fe-S oxidoreductase